MENSQLICRANQLTGFYMMATLAFNELSNTSPILSLEYIKCQNSISSTQLKDLVFPSDTTVQRSAVEQEDLKQHWKLEKRL